LKTGATSAESGPQRLERVLGWRHLLVYGMTVMQVVAPIPIFGLLEQRSNGNSVTTVLIGMLPMAFTAVSYGRMAARYPVSGSSYSYVSRALHPQLGFLIGWAILLDYLMIPLISAIIPALAIQRAVPHAPLPLLTFLIVAAMTVLNLGGIRATMRANTGLLLASSAAVLVFATLTILFLHRTHGVGSFGRVYDAATFQPHAILAGISLAALSYIGFDGLTTLSEDAINPGRDMPLVTVLVVLLTGLLSAVELYLLHSVIPDWHTTDPNTSYLDVMRIVGGASLFLVFLVVISASQFACGLSIQVSAARLLYGMGRDGALPRSLFGYLDPKRRTPSRNIVLIGTVTFLGALAIPFDHALDLLNFGAFLAYMGVNLAALWTFFVRRSGPRARRLLWDFVVPLSGFIGCLIFWLGLPERAKITGGVWFLVGLGYCAIKTRGFRTPAVSLDLSGGRQ